MSRFWWYGYNGWQPRWWNYLVPALGSDEWGRRTLVQHVPPFGFLVWAFRTCPCPDCRAIREQMAESERHHVTETADRFGGFMCSCGKASFSEKYGCMGGVDDDLESG